MRTRFLAVLATRCVIYNTRPREGQTCCEAGTQSHRSYGRKTAGLPTGTAIRRHGGRVSRGWRAESQEHRGSVAWLGNGRTGEFRGAFRTPENVGVEDGALQERERASRDIRRQVSRAENRTSTSDWRHPWGPVDRWRRAVMSDRPNTEPIEILLVEDNPGDARLAVEALKESKVSNRLHYVADGVEAMRFLRREGEYAGVAVPDLILLDLNLPRKDGREVLEEIKEDPQLRLIPVVILTTSAAERDLVKSYGLHANAYVVKPIDLDRFIEIVKAIEGFWFYIVKLPQDLDG